MAMGRGQGEGTGEGTGAGAPREGESLETKAAALVGLIETYAEEGRSASELTTSSQFVSLRDELARRGSY